MTFLIIIITQYLYVTILLVDVGVKHYSQARDLIVYCVHKENFLVPISWILSCKKTLQFMLYSLCFYCHGVFIHILLLNHIPFIANLYTTSKPNLFDITHLYSHL